MAEPYVPQHHFKGCDLEVHSSKAAETYGILGLRGKKKLIAVRGR